MTRGSWIGALLGVAAVEGASVDAHACEWSSVTSVIPEGAEHPANSAVVVLGDYVFFEAVTATIDGDAVAVVLDDELSVGIDGLGPPVFRVLAMRLDPEPLPGQTVVVDENPCCADPKQCPPYHIEYVATEPDEEVAADLLGVSFDLKRVLEVSHSGDGDFGSWVMTDLELSRDAFADETFVRLDQRAYHEALGLEFVQPWDLTWGPSQKIMLPPEFIGRAFPFEGWCVEVKGWDLAGNAIDPVSSCEACMIAVDDEYPIPWMPAPDGPCDDGTWTTTTSGGADTSSGGESTHDGSISTTEPSPMDSNGEPPGDGGDGGDTSGAAANDGGVTDRGCACASSVPTSTGAWLLLSMIAGRRRRARRR